MTDNIQRLEEKIAYLERHVTEQDKAMLAMADDLARLRRELQSLRGRFAVGGAASETPAPGGFEDERPPHY